MSYFNVDRNSLKECLKNAIVSVLYPAASGKTSDEKSKLTGKAVTIPNKRNLATEHASKAAAQQPFPFDSLPLELQAMIAQFCDRFTRVALRLSSWSGNVAGKIGSEQHGSAFIGMVPIARNIVQHLEKRLAEKVKEIETFGKHNSKSLENPEFYEKNIDRMINDLDYILSIKEGLKGNGYQFPIDDISDQLDIIAEAFFGKNMRNCIQKNMDNEKILSKLREMNQLFFLIYLIEGEKVTKNEAFENLRLTHNLNVENKELFSKLDL